MANKKPLQVKRQARHKQHVMVNVITSVMLLLACLCLISVWRTTRLSAQIQTEIETNKVTRINELDRLRYLEDRVKLLKNEDYVTKIARNRYYLSKEDEIIFSLPEDNDSKQAKAQNDAYLKEQAGQKKTQQN